MKKRVYCLYRVSTKKQVDRNDRNESDIPMQRTACHEFVSRQYGWEIIKEFTEKGVSGYKVSAQDRDAIQDLQAAAEKGEFDILLVFMFDRIGRIDDETPFVVEWFVKHGVEVWSTQEGEQRFDTHVDKLMNYIRFWQASGESEKTSIRIHSKMKQMAAEGLYTGGPVRFGYSLADSGRVNRKNRPIMKYVIDPQEREIVEMIDNLTIHKGYGSWRTADYLNRKGYKTKKDGDFTSIKIIRILKDPFYCGRLEDGTATPALQELQIRSEETYGRLQEILEQRSGRFEEKRNIAMQTKGQALLSGIAFCAHCGNRLTVIRYKDSRVRADGSIYRVDQLKYCCYHKTRKLCQCDGQTTYLADRIDEMVEKTMKAIFDGMKGAPDEEKLQALLKRQMASNRATQRKLETDLAKKREQLTKLQLEIGKSLTGDSVYTADDLSQAVRVIREAITEEEDRLLSLKEEEETRRQGVNMTGSSYHQFKSWAEEFDSATLEQKKMVVCSLFKRIEIGRDYQVSAELNITYAQFCEEWGEGNLLKNLAI